MEKATQKNDIIDSAVFIIGSPRKTIARRSSAPGNVGPGTRRPGAVNVAFSLFTAEAGSSF
jgi:hypothetical protein